jgi:hypothetical protein
VSCRTSTPCSSRRARPRNKYCNLAACSLSCGRHNLSLGSTPLASAKPLVLTQNHPADKLVPRRRLPPSNVVRACTRAHAACLLRQQRSVEQRRLAAHVPATLRPLLYVGPPECQGRVRSHSACDSHAPLLPATGTSPFDARAMRSQHPGSLRSSRRPHGRSSDAQRVSLLRLARIRPQPAQTLYPVRAGRAPMASPPRPLHSTFLVRSCCAGNVLASRSL